MEAASYFSRANEAFVDDNYEEALTLYNKAIDLDNTVADYYLKRASAYIKVKQYAEAVKDTDNAIGINPKDWKSFLRKGIALYRLAEFNKAKETFILGQKLNKNEESWTMWIEKCDQELKTNTKPESANADRTEGKPNEAATQPDQSITISDISQSSGTPIAVTQELSQIRHDWYQTESAVIINVFVKKVNPSDFNVQFMDNSVAIQFKDSNGNDRNMSFNFSNTIVPNQSKAKVLSTKIEIHLRKKEGSHWHTLVKTDQELCNVRTYPTSSHAIKDWNKLEADIKKEEKETKLEGDAALNQLFQQIYGDGNDEVKRAMMKSFVESKGTVLSTNWNEVKKDHVDCKPPDGMEFRNYEQ